MTISCRLFLAVLTSGYLLIAPSVRAQDAKASEARPAKPMVSLLSGGAEQDLKVLRETLEKIPGIKFKPDEIKFADFGRDGGLFTSFFAIEIADLAKTDIGAIAKAVAAANTSKKERSAPALFLIIKYRPDSVKTDQLRTVLGKVKGVVAEKSWAGDANLWVSVDGSGQSKLAEITRALHQAEIKFRDPITGTSEQP